MRKGVLGVTFLLLVSLCFFWANSLEREFDWTPTFAHNSDEPFGSQLFDEVASVTMPHGYTYFDGTADEFFASEKRRTLLLVGSDLYLDLDMSARLDSFVRCGNKLMLVAHNGSWKENKKPYRKVQFDSDFYLFSTQTLKKSLQGEMAPDTICCDKRYLLPIDKPLADGIIRYSDSYEATSWLGGAPLEKGEEVKVTDNDKNVFLVYQGDTVAYHEDGLDEPVVVDYRTEDDFQKAVQNIDGDRHLSRAWVSAAVTAKVKVVSAKMKVGRGEVHAVAAPLLFTNYGVLDRSSARYLHFTLSQVADQPVVRMPVGRFCIRFGDDNERDASARSLLYVLLDRPPLRWALYVLMAAIVLFMLFTARRRQRRIPVVERPANRNLEFVRLLGTIYYRRGDHLDLLRKKYTYFAEELRRTLLLDIDDPSVEATNLRLLAQKTGLEEDDIRATLKRVRGSLVQEKVGERELLLCIDKLDEIIKHL